MAIMTVFGVAQSRALLLGIVSVVLSLVAAAASIGSTSFGPDMWTSGASAGIQVFAPIVTLVLFVATVAKWRRSITVRGMPTVGGQQWDDRAAFLLPSMTGRMPKKLQGTEPLKRPAPESWRPPFPVKLGEPDPRTAKRIEFFEQAERGATTWVSALMQGVLVTVNDEISELRLSDDRQELCMNDEALPLVGIGFRMRGQKLELVVVDEGDVSHERTFLLSLAEGEGSLELALALKILRAAADSGQGVGYWSERPTDDLRRPSPVE